MTEIHVKTFLGDEPVERYVLRVRCSCGWTEKVGHSSKGLWYSTREQARQGLQLQFERHLAGKV